MHFLQTLGKLYCAVKINLCSMQQTHALSYIFKLQGKWSYPFFIVDSWQVKYIETKDMRM